MEVRVIEGEFKGEGVKIGVVVARFNDLLTNELLSGALDCFERHSVEEVDVVKVPGSFEIPLVAKSSPRAGSTTRFLPSEQSSGVRQSTLTWLPTRSQRVSQRSPSTAAFRLSSA